MSSDKLRRQIASEAARLMATGRENDLFRARRAASRRILRGWIRPGELPSDAEIRDEIERCAYLYEGDARFDNLRNQRLVALSLMQLLKPFRPRLFGSVLTGDVRRAGMVRLQAFADDSTSVRATLEAAGLQCQVAPEQVSRRGTRRTRIAAACDVFIAEVECYPAACAAHAFRNVTTGESVPRATMRQLSSLIRREYPDVQFDDLAGATASTDRFQVYRMLLLPLADVEQPRHAHPEGDALFHSLQVFEIVRAEHPWDEELQLAALLHDVGKAIDPFEHVQAGLAALAPYITDRTHWLIEQHSDARRLLDGTIGARARRRLQQHEDYDSLLSLARADRAGRVPGGSAPTLDEALDAIRDLARLCG
ncbi:MAG: tRNA adenylyltransferase [Planctomycetaceae bacterium]|nr:tRNA adenylyltransferase [Planctomycetaceae bacterium]